MRIARKTACFVACLGLATSILAQRPAQTPPAAPNTTTTAPAAKEEKNASAFNPDHQVVTQSEVTIKGKRIPYKATAGTLPVFGENQKVIAGLFFTYYERTDVKNIDERPLVISFNGGPGSASVWMHIGYTGPVLLNIDDEGYPVQPYGFTENKESILDVADIVFIDPVNTGYSRIVDHSVPKSTFFGVRADITYLAEWVRTFVTRYNRWGSPKYLIGESYGTTRVSGLADELQNSKWMFLNGVILVSPTELGITRGPALQAALRLPYFAATAWYHKKLAPKHQQRDLTAFLPEVEAFTMNELIPALHKGNSLSAAERTAIAAKMAEYSGLSQKVIEQNNLQVSTSFYWKELLREEGFTVGRLDSRYKGIDRSNAGTSPDYNAELDSWSHSFTPPINMYLRNALNYKTDLQYNMFGPVHPWDRTGDNTGERLRAAMAKNPNLHLLVQSGYYDGACDYFMAKYNLWHFDPSGKLSDRVDWKGYRSGHMMYLRKPDLGEGNEHIRQFILKSLPKKGAGAKYQ